jgi:hypothetical protein
MKRLLATTAIVCGALWFHPPTAHAIPTPFTDAFCGPLAEGGCGDGQKIFLDNAKAQPVLFGNVNANNHGPVVKITSDHNMMLVATLDSGGGFATITPGGKANFFSGIDVSIPGFEFTGLIFSVQMQPTANQLTTDDPLTIDGFRGTGASRLADLISPIETAKTDQDREFSITAVGGLGLFDDVDIFSTTGFKEIKHLKIEGLCQILASGGCQPLIVDASEPASLAILGLGVLGIGAVTARKRR